jgi:hypothetical protein
MTTHITTATDIIITTCETGCNFANSSIFFYFLGVIIFSLEPHLRQHIKVAMGFPNLLKSLSATLNFS